MRTTRKKPMKMKQTAGDRIFNIVVNVVIILAGIVALYPLLFVLSASISDPNAVNRGELWLLPIGLRWDGYVEVFKNSWILKGYANSLYYTIIGTLLNVVCTVAAGYALSRKDLYGRKVWNWYIAIPMWINGGLIPTYLVVNSMKLVNTPVVLLIMGLVSSYNIIICRTYMSSLPYELQEAAKIDGCSDFQILLRIVLPVSAPIIAVLSLYYAVGHWNNYFTAMIYVNNKDWQPLQVFLREFLLLNQTVDVDSGMELEDMIRQTELARSMKYSLIVIASVPMLIAYPFVQKFFIKGVMVGSVKG
ncbi:MAG: carbohydrate ABC transporter permease [Lachnospiraceae bacterium]|nr:carbohydrate ABC transporter permease [Lachnospiraceae bacterium]